MVKRLSGSVRARDGDAVRTKKNLRRASSVPSRTDAPGETAARLYREGIKARCGKPRLS